MVKSFNAQVKTRKGNIGICECKKPYECCPLCCSNFNNEAIHDVCKYQENKYGIPTLPSYKPIPGINYKTIPKVKVGMLTKFLYIIGYHKPFKGDEWKRN